MWCSVNGYGTGLFTFRTIRLLTLSMGISWAAGGCGGGGGDGGSRVPGLANASTTNLQVQVTDVEESPLSKAVINVMAGGSESEQTTDADGVARFPDLPSGDMTVSVSAAGFEPQRVATTFASGQQFAGFTLDAEGAWGIGRAIVFGASVVDRDSTGGSMTFSVDMAVMDENGEAFQTLTSADFSVLTIDCAWLGPRGCASDAEGNATGSFSPDGAVQAFELHADASRHPYLAAVLVERSSDVCGIWSQATAALESFFSALGGNDVASLMTLQTQNSGTTLIVHGPFSNDGATYLDVIAGLDCSEEGEASPAATSAMLSEAIDFTASADGFGLPDVERYVVVVAIAELSKDSRVHISSVPYEWNDYGVPEVAVRTGGFVSFISDWQWRDAGMVFGTMDQVLAGTVPFYRVQFRLTGGEGTFVSGGNVKVHMRIDVPTLLPNRGVRAVLDVAIP
jgi:hypothetical protein